MLLIEQQEGDIFIAYYDSTNILMSKYIYSEKKLSVIFNKGQQYIYKNVTAYHYQRFKLAPSQGKGLSEHIIKNYIGVKADLLLEDVVLDGVKKQILEIKQQKNI